MKCISLLRCLHQVEVIDKSHCSLEDVPNLQNYSRSLEELFLDANKLTRLTKPLFRLTRLRRLNVSDNIIQDIPPDIGNLVNLVELDCSRNKIEKIPDQIKFLRSLQICDFSGNNIENLPIGLVQLENLTTLNLNYCLLKKLPQDFGTLKNLESLELRENELFRLPKSFTLLKNLRRLDLGQNLLKELPDDIGKLRNLEYLLVDTNNLQTLPDDIGRLDNLLCLDVVRQERDNIDLLDDKDRGLKYLPEEISGLKSLTDLYLSDNNLTFLPNGIGQLKNLITLKADKNNLTELNSTIGGCIALQELVLTCNELRELPDTIGLLSDLRTLNVDENKLHKLTPQIGCLKKLGILSLRDNRLVQLPSEVGYLKELVVLDLANNLLEYLPSSLTNLNLGALWLSTNQAQPLLKLQTDQLPSGTNILTCFLLPQVEDGPQLVNIENNRRSSTAVKFDNDAVGEDGDSNNDVQFVRHDTPHPKELKARNQKFFTEKTVAFDQPKHEAENEVVNEPTNEPVNGPENGAKKEVEKEVEREVEKEPRGKLHRRDTPHHLKNQIVGVLSKEDKQKVESIVKDKKRVIYIDVYRTDPGIGLSIAGGKNTPPYKDDDEGIFVSKVTKGGPTEAAGVKVKDKILAVNDEIFYEGITHNKAVEIFKKVKSNCEKFTLKVLRDEEESQTPHIIYTTLINDKQGSLGLGIEGDANSSNVTITSIQPDSVAAKDGKLQANDRILSINGTDVAGLTNERVVSLLRTPDRFVRIVVARGESNDPLDEALRSMPARPPLGSWYSSSSYMAHRPSFTGSYRRPTFSSVSSLASGDVSLNVHNIANSSAAIPGMLPTLQSRSGSMRTRLQGLRSHEPTFLPQTTAAEPPKPKVSPATVSEPSNDPEVLSFSEKKRKFEQESNANNKDSDEINDTRASSTTNPVARPRTAKAEMRLKKMGLLNELDQGTVEARARWRKERLKSLDDDAQMAKIMAEAMNKR